MADGFDAKIIDQQRLLLQTKKFTQMFPEVIRRRLKKGVADFDRHVMRKVKRGPRSGRIYDYEIRVRSGEKPDKWVFVPQNGGMILPAFKRPRHQASAAGEPWKEDHGGETEAFGIDLGALTDFSVEWGSESMILVYLEAGTRYMEPRPTVEPAYQEFAPIFENLIETGLKDIFPRPS